MLDASSFKGLGSHRTTNKLVIHVYSMTLRLANCPSLANPLITRTRYGPFVSNASDLSGGRSA